MVLEPESLREKILAEAEDSFHRKGAKNAKYF
jgi:hypothetical protein